MLPFDRLLSLLGKADSGAAAFADHRVGEDLLANIVLLLIVINAIVV